MLKIWKEQRKAGRKLLALFLGMMLLLLPFAFSPPTLAEDNSPAADVIPDSLKNAPPLMAPSSGIAIDYTNFPDENFRDYIKSDFDRNNDDFISQDELSRAKALQLYSSKHPVADLHGLDYFTSSEVYRNTKSAAKQVRC